MQIRQREMTHHKDKEQLKMDLERQKELNEFRVDRQLQREEAKLKVRHLLYI